MLRKTQGIARNILKNGSLFSTAIGFCKKVFGNNSRLYTNYVLKHKDTEPQVALCERGDLFSITTRNGKHYWYTVVSTAWVETKIIHDENQNEFRWDYDTSKAKYMEKDNIQCFIGSVKFGHIVFHCYLPEQWSENDIQRVFLSFTRVQDDGLVADLCRITIEKLDPEQREMSVGKSDQKQ